MSCFADVQPGAWFKCALDGRWYLKTSDTASPDEGDNAERVKGDGVWFPEFADVSDVEVLR